MAYKTAKQDYPTVKVGPMNQATGPYGQNPPNAPSPSPNVHSSPVQIQARTRMRYAPAAGGNTLGGGRLVDPGTEALGGGRIVPSRRAPATMPRRRGK